MRKPRVRDALRGLRNVYHTFDPQLVPILEMVDSISVTAAGGTADSADADTTAGGSGGALPPPPAADGSRGKGAEAAAAIAL